MDRILCTAYGDSSENKGIAIIGTDKNVTFLNVDGKCNFCIENKDRLYVPVQNGTNQIIEYRRENENYVQDGIYQTEYFYSHGTFFEGKLILASFSDGVDAIYDPETHKETDLFVHSREGRDEHGRSHYIGITPDHKYVYSVDNGLQQIYMYKIEDGKFILVDIREFSQENIRLMPISSYSKCAYLNTETTNRIYILSYENERFHISDMENMESSDKCFSGGNSISANGKRLCVSLRGDNILHYYEINKDGKLKLLSRIACGDMPRDILFKNGHIYVSCTNDNKIEVYDPKDDQLKKINEIFIKQPVTFACA